MFPADHAYALYSALAALIEGLHSDERLCMIAPIPGLYVGNGRLQIQSNKSRLWLRLHADDIPRFLPLVGQEIQIGGQALKIGVPQVRSLVPASALIARTVTIKGFKEPGPFLEAAQRQLDALSFQAELGIPLVREGKHEGEPRRRVVRIRDKRIVGFTLQATGLTAQDSIMLQESGLGGRRHLGCGFFIPLKPTLA
jgi:CRISPR-associated protein Cas6